MPQKIYSFATKKLQLLRIKRLILFERELDTVAVDTLGSASEGAHLMDAGRVVTEAGGGESCVAG